MQQTLRDVWPSLGLVHYIYIFGGSCPRTEFCQVQIHFASESSVLLHWQRYCTALEQCGRVAITLGVGPHFGLVCDALLNYCFIYHFNRRWLLVKYSVRHVIGPSLLHCTVVVVARQPDDAA